MALHFNGSDLLKVSVGKKVISSINKKMNNQYFINVLIYYGTYARSLSITMRSLLIQLSIAFLHSIEESDVRIFLTSHKSSFSSLK